MNTPDLNFVQFNVILKEIWSPLQLIAANKSIGINYIASQVEKVNIFFFINCPNNVYTFINWVSFEFIL